MKLVIWTKFVPEKTRYESATVYIRFAFMFFKPCDSRFFWISGSSNLSSGRKKMTTLR